jgi:glyoxylase-like metal-dependent hydrolase (beta-lactamase superfamily II)
MKMKPFDELADGVLVSMNDPMFPLYILRGEQPVLIDSGVSRLAETFLARIHQVLGEQKLARIVLTHSHWDHCGALTAIADAHQAEVWGSPQVVDLLQKENVIAFINRLNRDFAKPEQRDALPLLHTPHKLKALSDGERLPLDEGRSLLAVAAPGHTRCSQAYLLEPEGILFPGDAVGVMERDGEVRPLFLSSYSDYLESLQKLSRLSVNAIAFCHNRIIRGPKAVAAFFEKTLKATQTWYETIRSGLLEGKDENVIAEEILETAFFKTTIQGPREAFVINIIAMTRAVEKVMNASQGAV